MRLDLGKPVHTWDGELVGALADVILDPVEKRLTHLGVTERSGHGGLHHVPVELAVPDDGRATVSLRCLADDIKRLPNAHGTSFLQRGEPLDDDLDWDVGVVNVRALPFLDSGAGPGLGFGSEYVEMDYDLVPRGKVELRRSSSVFAADGRRVGDVEGLLLDGDRVTHVVLERGHLWRRREVTVPVGPAARVETDAVTVDLSEDELAALPARRVHRWAALRRKS